MQDLHHVVAVVDCLAHVDQVVSKLEGADANVLKVVLPAFFLADGIMIIELSFLGF